MTPSPVTSLTTSYDHYIRHGWALVPIAPGSKGPKTRDWNKRENCIINSSQIPPGHGVGLAHAYSGTMALDIDNWDIATTYFQSHGINLQELFDAPDAVTIESGNAGHGKLIFSMPFGSTLPSKKLVDKAIDGTRTTFLEFRCATRDGLTVQDVLPPSIHPVTQRPYQWGGNGRWERLPTIPFNLLQHWQSLVEQDTRKVVKVDGGTRASWSELQQVLESVNPDCPRDEWIQIGMALHHAGAISYQADAAYQVWDEWSSKGEKYKGQSDINACWRSFDANRDDGITVGTLYHIAESHGYRRPMPEISHLFSEVTIPPEELVKLATSQTDPVELPIDLFPPILARRALELAEDTGAALPVSMFATLACVSAVADARSRLQLKGTFKVPPILWLLILGDASSKKSAGATGMFDILKTLEMEDKDRYQAAHLVWEGQEAAYASAKKAFIEHCQTPDLANTVPPSVPVLPEEPVPLRLRTKDSTSQAIVKAARGRDRGFLAHMDELSGWLKRVTDKNSTEDRGTWIAAYESQSYIMDRVSSGTVEVDNLAVTIFSNVQPSVFDSYLPALATDGTVQRFIMVVVPEMRPRKGKPVPDYLSNKVEYEAAIRKIYAQPVREYILSSEAYDLFDQFQDWYADLYDAERLIGSSSAYLTALGKIEGTCGRLALIFHLADHADAIEVSGDTMRRAIEVTKQFVVPHLRRALNPRDSQLEKWIIDYVVMHAGEIPQTSIAIIRHSLGPHFKARGIQANQNLDQQIRMICDILTEKNYIALLRDTRQGGAIYAINPAIAEAFSEERAAKLRAKALVYRETRASVRANTGFADLNVWGAPAGIDPDTGEILPLKVK